MSIFRSENRLRAGVPSAARTYGKGVEVEFLCPGGFNVSLQYFSHLLTFHRRQWCMSCDSWVSAGHSPYH
jgi:hypothetical protein